MAENHSLRLEIDAAAAKSGATEYEAAINKIRTATANLVTSTDAAFTKIDQRLGSLNFGKVATELAKISGLKIDATLVRNLDKLATASAAFKGINPAAIASIHQLSGALKNLGTSTTASQIAAMTAAMSAFRAPTATQTNNLNSFANALSQLKPPANAAAVISSLKGITAAMVQTRAAIQGLNTGGPSTIRIPNVRGGNTGGGSSGTGSYGGSGMFSGLGPGRSRATSVRGFENVGNVGYQAGSALRGAVGALTAGSVVSQMLEAINSAESFKSSLKATGSTAEDVARQIQLVSTASQTFGMDLYTTREQFAQFTAAARGAGVATSEVEKMFSDASGAMTAMGMGAVKQEGALRAFQQMFSKGRVSSEELFQQAAEHWAGFPALVADAMGIPLQTLRDRMQKEVLDPKILQTVLARARQSTDAALQEASQRPAAALGRLRTEWRLLMEETGKGTVGTAISEQVDALVAALRRPEFREFVGKLGMGLADIIKTVGAAAVWAADHTETLANAFKILVGVGAINFMVGLGGAVNNALGPLRAMSTALFTVSAGATAGATAMSLLRVAMIGLPLTLFAGLAALAYTNRDAMVTFGESTVTVGAMAKQGWEEALDAMSSSATAWWNASKPVFDQALTAIIEWGTGLKANEQTVQNFFTTLGSASDTWVNSFLNKLIAVKSGIEWVFASANILDARSTSWLPSGLGGSNGATPEMYAARDAAGANFRDAMSGKTRMDIFGAGAAALAGRASRKNMTPDYEEGAAAGQVAPVSPTGPAGAPRVDPNKMFHAKPGNGKGAEAAARRLENERLEFNRYRAKLDPSFEIANDIDVGKNKMKNAQSKGWITDKERIDLEGKLRDSMLETLNVLDPRIKAENHLKEATGLLDGMMKQGILTDDQRAAALGRIKERLKDNLDPYGHMLTNMRQENELYALSTREMAVQATAREKINQLREKGITLSAEQKTALEEEIRLTEQLKNAQSDREEGLTSWANGFRSIDVELKKLEATIADDLTDALATFVSTGKADFNSLATSIVTDVNKLIIKEGIRTLMRELGIIGGDTKSGFSSGSGNGSLIGTIGGLLGAASKPGSASSGGILGGLMDMFAGAKPSLGPNSVSDAGAQSVDALSKGLGAITKASSGDVAGSAGGMLSGVGDAVSSAAKGVGSWIASFFEEGGISTNPVKTGIMPAHAFASAPHYREGTANTSGGGMPAILHPNEAVIPLSRGRRIPIEMPNAAGMGGANIVMNIHTPDADSFRRSESQMMARLGAASNRAMRRNG